MSSNPAAAPIWALTGKASHTISPMDCLPRPTRSGSPISPWTSFPYVVTELHPEGTVQAVQRPQPGEDLCIQDVVLTELYLQGVAGGEKPERKRYEQDCEQDRE